jgi:hypothetical protein
MGIGALGLGPARPSGNLLEESPLQSFHLFPSSCSGPEFIEGKPFKSFKEEKFTGAQSPCG